MTQKVKDDNTIIMTRGDTLRASVTPVNKDGTPYEPQEGDSIRFAMKKNYTDLRTVLVKSIPTDTMMLTIDASETKGLEFGDYVYDVQLTKANGDVDTFIAKARLRLTEEVE